jgi:hypothetical protein
MLDTLRRWFFEWRYPGVCFRHELPKERNGAGQYCSTCEREGWARWDAKQDALAAREREEAREVLQRYRREA